MSETLRAADEGILREAYEHYFIARAGRNSKVGLGQWNTEDRSIEEILWHVRHGGNVALRVGQTRSAARVCCIDLDNKSSRLRAQARELGFASDMEVITASGKRHIYGRIPETILELRTKIKALDRAWDAKLTGLMIFVPSKIDDGAYRLPRGKSVVPPAELPVFESLSILVESQQEPRIEAARGDTLSMVRGLVTRQIRHPKAYVLCIESHQGSNGSAGLVRAVCALRDCGWSPREVFDFLVSEWNAAPRVVPLWSHEEILYCINRHMK